MKTEAVPLGAKLLDQEAALDQQFANHSITPETLKAATAQIDVASIALTRLTADAPSHHNGVQ
jgi:hypothetical protein